MNTEYDTSHKASSITSTISNSSIWDPLPSLYTERADSVSSAYELDEPESFEGFSYDSYNHNLYDKKEEATNDTTTTTTANISEFLNSFFKEQEEDNILKKGPVIDHEVPSSPNSCHAKRKRLDEEQQQQQDNRELLSNDKKRANHIASEQKRRNTIRGGFKELTEIIPTLKNVNNSKSTILFKSVDYIKQLDKRNKSLKDRLALLQLRAQQKQQLKKNYNNPALTQHKNQQKQLELLQEQLRVQQALLTKHNIPLLYGYHHSISIPIMGDTPVTSATTSPTIQHASLPQTLNIVNNIHHHNHLFMPADNNNNNNHSSAPSFNIPADDHHYNQHAFRERLLSSGKLNHLRKDSL